MQGEIKKFADGKESILIYNADRDIFSNQPVFTHNNSFYILIWSGSWRRDKIQKVKAKVINKNTKLEKQKSIQDKERSSSDRQEHKVGKAGINTG